jgi:hypothetical protein
LRTRKDNSGELGGDPAVDDKFGGGHLLRRVRRQIERGLGDIPGFAHVTHGALLVTATHLLDAAIAIDLLIIGVFMRPGLMTLERMLLSAYCRATPREKPSTGRR